jgi:hypothetical protein
MSDFGTGFGIGSDRDRARAQKGNLARSPIQLPTGGGHAHVNGTSPALWVPIQTRCFNGGFLFPIFSNSDFGNS